MINKKQFIALILAGVMVLPNASFAVNKKPEAGELNAAMAGLKNAGLANPATASIYDLQMYDELLKAGATLDDTANNRYIAAKIMSDSDSITTKLAKLTGQVDKIFAANGSTAPIIAKAVELVESNKKDKDYAANKAKLEQLKKKLVVANTREVVLADAGDANKKLTFTNMSNDAQVLLLSDIPMEDGSKLSPNTKLWYISNHATKEEGPMAFTVKAAPKTPKKPITEQTGPYPFIMVLKDKDGKVVKKIDFPNWQQKKLENGMPTDEYYPDGAMKEINVTEPWVEIEFLVHKRDILTSKESKTNDRLPLMRPIPASDPVYDAVFQYGGLYGEVRVIEFKDGTTANVFANINGIQQVYKDVKVSNIPTYTPAEGSIHAKFPLVTKDMVMKDNMWKQYAIAELGPQKPQEPEKTTGEVVVEYYDKETKKVFETMTKTGKLGDKIKVVAEELLDYDLVSEKDSVEVTFSKESQRVRFEYELNIGSKTKKRLGTYNDSLKDVMSELGLKEEVKPSEGETKPGEKAADIKIMKGQPYIKGTGKDSLGRALFSPSKSLTRAEAIQMVYNNLMITMIKPLDVPFTDISGKWYELAVSDMAKAGVIGTGQVGMLGGNSTMSRGEFAELIARAISGEAGDVMAYKSAVNSPFSDAQLPAVAYLAEKGLINGFPDGTFKPDNKLTRAEAVIILNGVLAVQPSGSMQFADVPSSHWAFQQINGAANVQ